MTIAPDTKDWTWVLERPCPDCGFEAGAVDRSDVGRLLRENAAAWRGLVEHPDARQRPDESTWSALEYACHVRDVFSLYEYRLNLMLDADDPTFPNWDQDESAVADHYGDQDPDEVVAALEEAGAVLGDHFDALPDTAWGRTGNRSDGARFTIDTFARYLAHDPIHHVHDVASGYDVIAAVNVRNRS